MNKLKAGTIVKVKGIPFELLGDVEVETTKGNALLAKRKRTVKSRSVRGTVTKAAVRRAVKKVISMREDEPIRKKRK